MPKTIVSFLSFEEYLEKIAALDATLTEASMAMQEFPKGEMGLTPDDVKASPEFQAAKARYNNAFQAVRHCNASVPNDYKRKRSQLRREAMRKERAK